MQKKADKLRLLPWVIGGEVIDSGTPNIEQSEAIAMYSVRLPYVFNRRIDETIEAIETMMTSESL